MASLTDALFTATQRKVLARLFDGRDGSYSVNQLIRLTGAGSGAVQRELARLAGSGLLGVEQVGNQKRYRANSASPIHDELVAIVRKTFGLAAPLREALAPFADRMTLAFVFGSVARATDRACSDVDLLIASDFLDYGDVIGALHSLMEDIGREVNPVIYSPADLMKRIQEDSPFIRSVALAPKIWVHGATTALARFME